MMPPLTPLTPQQEAELAKRRRGRNWALLIVLLGLSALFFAITIVKLQATS